MVVILEKELNSIKRVHIDANVLNAFKSEEDFLALAVDLLVETGSYANNWSLIDDLLPH